MLPIIIQSEISIRTREILQNRWGQFLLRKSVNRTLADELFEYLNLHYSEKHRAYHNWSHIHSLLKIKDLYTDFLKDNWLVELAIWIHDLVYDPQRKDNEKVSYELAATKFQDFLGLAELKKLEALVLSTEKHLPLADSGDIYFFLDFDLAVLGTSPQTYTTYSEAIRQEYNFVPLSFYQQGRAQVLTRFLDRPRLYYTDLFQQQLETLARENLIQEIKQLQNSK